MTRRASGFDLVTALADPGFTPSRRDVPPLLDLLVTAPADVREHAERALRRTGAPALEAAMARAKEAPPEARARLVGLVARMADDDVTARTFLLEAVADPEAPVRKRAAAGLGRSREGEGAGVAAALATALACETDAAARAALVAALGKIGGATAQEALRSLATTPPAGAHATAPAHDRGPEGERAAALDDRTAAELRKARLRAARQPAREEASVIDVTTPLDRPVRVWLECRRGLLPVLLEEAAALAPRIAHRIDGSAVAEIVTAGPLEKLFASRTWLTAALPGEIVPASQPDRVPSAARAIAAGEPHAAAAALTRGPLRYRIAWASGGKRRAEVYRLAEAAAALDPALINDPTDAPWQVVLRETPKSVVAEWAPSFTDPRFAYRTGDVPAASHPTIAAALAFLAAAHPADVVWDPFVGSGLELCERALRGPYRRLVGTDIDPAALDVARANLQACGAERHELTVRDAAAGAPKGLRPTLVITNPPLGRRVHRQADLRAFLCTFVSAVARALAPEGRFVWVSPFPADTRAAAIAAGLTPRRGHVVDMGGFEAEIQLFTADR